MNFHYKYIGVDSNNCRTYKILIYEEVDKPIEFIEEKLLVQIYLDDRKFDRVDLLLKEKQGQYLSEHHAFMTFFKTFKKLPYSLMKKFLSLCDKVVIKGNIKEPQYTNRFEVHENSLLICKECVYDEVFLIDAVAELIMDKSCALVGSALHKVVPEQVDDIRSAERKEIIQSIKDFISYWKGHGSYSQRLIANNLEKYCKTPRHDKNDERPFIDTLESYRGCEVQFFVFYMLIMSDEEMMDSVDNYNGIAKIIRLMENVYRNLKYLD